MASCDVKHFWEIDDSQPAPYLQSVLILCRTALWNKKKLFELFTDKRTSTNKLLWHYRFNNMELLCLVMLSYAQMRRFMNSRGLHFEDVLCYISTNSALRWSMEAAVSTLRVYILQQPISRLYQYLFVYDITNVPGEAMCVNPLIIWIVCVKHVAPV